MDINEIRETFDRFKDYWKQAPDSVDSTVKANWFTLIQCGEILLTSLDNLTAELEEVKSYTIDRDMENKELRKLIWLRHGCPITSLYGDDGEMQCSRCGIDFKRSPVAAIIERFEAIAVKALEDARCESCGGTGEVCKTCGKNHFGKVYRHPYFLVPCKDCASNPTGKRFTDPIYQCQSCGKSLECLHVQIWRRGKKAIKIHDCAHPCQDCPPRCDSCGEPMKKTGQVPEYGEEVGKPGSRIPVGMNELFECGCQDGEKITDTQQGPM